MNINPITKTDYPDPDVIRVDDTYYMISTTMYYMPGGVILRSYDLVNWEIATYIFDELDGTDSEKLLGDESNYGKGMWAACLRYHNNKFYAAFVSHGRKDTHLFIADSIGGPWEHKTINEYFHDCSILFDDDGRTFLISGNTNIRLVELNSELSGIKEGGIDKIIIKDIPEDVILGYEGAHFYKINGKYYITLIHWPKYNMRRTEAVFVSDTVDGEYIGKDVFWDDMGIDNRGVAQGGLVDTPEGKWYAVLFQDSGAVGRVPVLVPVEWLDTSVTEAENEPGSFVRGSDASAYKIEKGYMFPVYGVDGLVPQDMEVISTKPGYQYESLFVSDDFSSETIKKQWQWNHVQDNSLWKIEDNKLKITTGKICVNPVWARNTLTQRMALPECQATVTVDASKLNNGDMAGLIALEGCYAMIGIAKEDDKYYVVKLARTSIEKPFQIGYTDREAGEILHKQEIDSSVVKFKLLADFRKLEDKLECYYEVLNLEPEEVTGLKTADGNDDTDSWIKAGDSHKMRFGLDHFTGARFGLCVFSQKQTGGEAAFSEFKYEIL